MIKVKICGITNTDDAQFAIEQGADYLGLIFAPSKRQIIVETAIRIMQSTPQFTNYVGIFLNGKKKTIEDICTETGLKIVQFHGDESPAFCNYFINRGIDVIKVFRVESKQSLVTLSEYKKVNMFLFDTYANNQHGGTGKPFNWSLLKGVAELKEKKVFISGGLNSENVKEVITLLHPYAVDASSSLEHSIGIKDKEKVCRFIEAVKRVK